MNLSPKRPIDFEANRRAVAVRISREWRPLGYRVRLERRSRQEAMGRFGGGWQVALGFKLGDHHLLLMLGFFTIMIELNRGSKNG